MNYFHGVECCRFEPHFPSLLYARQHNRARRRAYCRHDCLRRRRRTGGHRRHRGGQRQSQVRSPSNMRSKKKIWGFVRLPTISTPSKLCLHLGHPLTASEDPCHKHFKSTQKPILSWAADLHPYWPGCLGKNAHPDIAASLTTPAARST